MLPPRVRELIQLFAKLPSVGEKTAQRFALFLAASEPETARMLGEALIALGGSVDVCARCGNLAEKGEPSICVICADRKRDPAQLCVVARIRGMPGCSTKVAAICAAGPFSA